MWINGLLVHASLIKINCIWKNEWFLWWWIIHLEYGIIREDVERGNAVKIVHLRSKDCCQQNAFVGNYTCWMTVEGKGRSSGWSHRVLVTSVEMRDWHLLRIRVWSKARDKVHEETSGDFRGSRLLVYKFILLGRVSLTTQTVFVFSMNIVFLNS